MKWKKEDFWGFKFRGIFAGQTLTWDLDQDMEANKTLMVEFTARTTAPPGGTSVNTGQASGTFGGTPYNAEDTANIDVSNLIVSKVSSEGGTVDPGDAVTYTVTITNNGSGRHNNIVASDPVPAGTCYTSQSTVVTGYTIVTAMVADYYDAFQDGLVYTGTDGSFTWSNPWVENDTDGGGSTGGNILVQTIANCPSGTCLRFENEDSGDYIYRAANLIAGACATADSVTLEYDYNNLLGGSSNELEVRI